MPHQVVVVVRGGGYLTFTPEAAKQLEGLLDRDDPTGQTSLNALIWSPDRTFCRINLPRHDPRLIEIVTPLRGFLASYGDSLAVAVRIPGNRYFIDYVPDLELIKTPEENPKMPAATEWITIE